MIHLLYFLLGIAFAAFVGWVLDCLGIIDYWRVRFLDESGDWL